MADELILVTSKVFSKYLNINCESATKLPECSKNGTLPFLFLFIPFSNTFFTVWGIPHIRENNMTLVDNGEELGQWGLA